jgi:hypothetical protein
VTAIAKEGEAMGCQPKQNRRTDEAEGHGPRGFAEFWRRFMPAKMQERYGDQMREMMSRCMAHLHDAQGGQGKTEQTEA